MKTPNRFVLRWASLLAVLPCAVWAASSDAIRAENRTTAADSRPALKQADKNFLENAVKAGMEEAEITRVALERTSNPRVREYAQMLLSDHLKTNDTLALIAANRGISVPAKNNDANAWTKKDGKNFDKDYIDKMVSSHEDSVKLFQKQAVDGEDPEAVAFARKTLPRLQHHLEQASDLQRLMN